MQDRNEENHEADYEDRNEMRSGFETAKTNRKDLNAAETAEAQHTGTEDHNADETLRLDPMLEKFLDAKTYTEKAEILDNMRDKITESMMQTISISLDLSMNATDPVEQYDEIRNCLFMMKKYESDRLR